MNKAIRSTSRIVATFILLLLPFTLFGCDTGPGNQTLNLPAVSIHLFI